jgi:hypothetical protein
MNLKEKIYQYVTVADYRRCKKIKTFLIEDCVKDTGSATGVSDTPGVVDTGDL